MQPSEVTVIIPTFNRVSSCLEAVKSVLAQTVSPAQIIVVDDGSSDDLTPIVTLLSENGGMLIQRPRSGVSAARNAGVARARTKWVAFLDSDDLWLPKKLERQIALHQENPDLVYSQTAERWLRNGVELRQRPFQAPARGDCFSRLLEICCISTSALIIRKDVLVCENGFDVTFPVCEDYDLWLRLSARYPIGLVDEALVIKNRGRGDHLSESIEALDRFRVRALVGILRRKLSTENRILATKALNEKLSILELGAKKRDLRDDLERYRRIRCEFLPDPLPIS